MEKKLSKYCLETLKNSDPDIRIWDNRHYYDETILTTINNAKQEVISYIILKYFIDNKNGKIEFTDGTKIGSYILYEVSMKKNYLGNFTIFIKGYVPNVQQKIIETELKEYTIEFISLIADVLYINNIK